VVLRYPPLPEGVPFRPLDPIGYDSRIGKNAYWLPMGELEDEWRERLIGVLHTLISGKS
jgi:hypothetical protein